MTTMNYPANYTAIAADEMVYLDGGSIWSDLGTCMGTASAWIDLVANPVYTLSYLASVGTKIEDGVTGIGQVASLITAVGQTLRFLGLSMTSWIGFPDLIGA